MVFALWRDCEFAHRKHRPTTTMIMACRTDPIQENSEYPDEFSGFARIVDRPKVLIADDEEPVRSLIARALQMDGHATMTAQDGAEALDYIFATGEYADRNIGDGPKVVFLDLKNVFDTLDRPR